MVFLDILLYCYICLINLFNHIFNSFFFLEKCCSFKVLLFAGVIGIFVLLPVNCSGDQLEDVDLVNISNNSLDVFTISNVKDGSHWYVLITILYLI